MRIFRLIAPEWAVNKTPGLKRVLEGQFTDIEIKKYNKQGYNVYIVPNHPKEYTKGVSLDGTLIDTFEYVFVDMDLKDGIYLSKNAFLDMLATIEIPPTKVIDSGNGVHAYWKVSDLDAMSYLRLSRRFMRLLKTDEKVGQIFQLMRHPGTMNTKVEDRPKPCTLVYEEDSIIYTCEQLDQLLPPITVQDEKNAQQHYDKTYNHDRVNIDISATYPPKFGDLLRSNNEVKQLFAGNNEDRSGADFRLGHILFANDFTREEAVQVLVHTAKASTRAPIHRVTYAENIVDKIWEYEAIEDDAGLDEKLEMSSSVLEILEKNDGVLEGTRLPCFKYIDNTEGGFRLGHVLGLVAGAGVGKTAMAMNLFMGFVASNPDYEHFFVPLEQTDKEIAMRWKAMCGTNTKLHRKVHIMSNYDGSGAFRDLSLKDIKDYILKFQRKTGKKIGCVVIDHIGILCNNNKHGIDEGVKEISKAMKGFAIETNTFLIMQSQTAREKAGIGDLELNKDAAFGTSVFENFCDFLVTIWQPLKRVYEIGAPTIMAYKFCKIRHKKQGIDIIQEDVPYTLFFDPTTQLLREMTQDEEESFSFYLKGATNKRKADRKTDLVAYKSVKWNENNRDNA